MPEAAVCPICKKPLPNPSGPFRPFCSHRCKMADLGSWLNGNYRIQRGIDEEDLDESPRLDQGDPSDLK